MTSTLVKTSVLALAVISLAAAGCTRRAPEPAGTTQTGGPTGTGGPSGTGTTGGVTGGATGAITAGSVRDFTINVGDRVYFDYDSYTVRADASRILAAQAAWLARYPQVQVRIEGNADERGTREYNLALGARRAEAARSFLIANGVPASRIDSISYGSERPIAMGSDDNAWAQNRNAHTTVTGGAPQ